MLPRTRSYLVVPIALAMAWAGLVAPVSSAVGAERAGNIPRPVVTKVAPKAGLVTGGERVTVRGRHFTKRTTVRIGNTKAWVKRRNSRRLVVIAPAGIEGPAKVTVANGRKRAKKKPSYTYRLPAPVSKARLDAADNTYVASDVEWVSGGPSIDRDPEATADSPYIVSLATGTTPPVAGQPFLIRPGNAAYGTGLAGTVESVGFQADDSLRVLVEPSPLTDALDSIDVEQTSSGTPGGLARSKPSNFDSIGVGAFECSTGDDREAPVSFTAALDITVGQVNNHFKFEAGGLFSRPTLDTWTATEITVAGTFGVSADMAGLTCSLKKSWSNANKRGLFFPGGVSVSLTPVLSLKLSGSGSVSFEQTTHIMYGVSRTGNDAPERINVARSDPAKITGNASMSLTLKAGLDIRVGWMDRVGISLEASLEAQAALEREWNPDEFCAKVSFAFVFDASIFFDVWVKEWKIKILAFRKEFAKFDRCAPLGDGPGPDPIPVIISDTLTDATIGEPYDYDLETRDGAPGRWTVVDGSLPPGLHLDTSGRISGTPTSGIGSRQFRVSFLDADSERSTTATLALRILPDATLGGGDIQATLTWDGPADLDLHGWEPDDTEIYYNQPGPTYIGGELDHDANAGCGTADEAPAENIKWNSDAPTTGTYWFNVVVWSECEAADLSWHLVVRVDGVVRVDEYGYGDSDYFELDYPSGTSAQVTPADAVDRRPASTPKS